MLLLLFRGRDSGGGPPVVINVDNRDGTGAPSRNATGTGAPSRNATGATNKGVNRAGTGRPPD